MWPSSPVTPCCRTVWCVQLDCCWPHVLSCCLQKRAPLQYTFSDLSPRTGNTSHINLLGRFSPAVTLWAGKRTTSVRFIRFGSPFSSECVVYGRCLVTLSHTINETLKWLSSLSIYLNAGVTLVVTVSVRYIPHPPAHPPPPPDLLGSRSLPVPLR